MSQQPNHAYEFGEYRLEVAERLLLRHGQAIPLQPKIFDLLLVLVEHRNHLLEKDQLLHAVWPDAIVEEANLSNNISILRKTLGDSPNEHRYIETVPKYGYRFIAPVAETSLPALPTKATTTSATEAGAPADLRLPRGAASRCLVGREAEWAQLREWYASVQQGNRRIGFVAGEAGIGKTVLVEAFVSEVAARGEALIARGQCIQQYGAGEAYLPILEALGRLARDNTLPVGELLRNYAPSWLAHLPSPVPGGEFEAPTPVTSERMLRELADALEILTAKDTLILVLEDLHWSDTATVEWLGYIARRRGAARLQIVGTYRPVEALLHNHPLRSLIAELRPHPQCPELVLDYLSSESVQSYLRQRCGPTPRLREFAEVLHRRTRGHPLFLTTIVDELMRQQFPESADLRVIANVIPASLRQFIEHSFGRLSGEEQTILEASSVAGDSFSVAAVVAATSLPEEQIEARCAAWTREDQFLTADGTVTWPDGTLAARYAFRHDLFQEVVYARISSERRARLHQRIGSRLESAYGKRAATIAAELAMHFDQGREPRKAASYLEQAARNALQRSAYPEAGRHLTRGREIIEALPEDHERLRLEIELSLLLGKVLMATKGWGVEDVSRVYGRARELCVELGDTSRLLQATWGLMWMSVVRAELGKTQSLARELLRLANKQRDSVFQVVAHHELGVTAYHLGDTISARKHFREADVLYDPRQHLSHIARIGVDAGLFSRIYATHALWHEGYPDQARVMAEETVGRARDLAHPLTQAITLAYATMLNQFRRDVEEVDRLAKATISHTTEHGFPYYLVWAEVLKGWSGAVRGVREEGIAKIRRGIEVLQTIAGLRLPYYRALLAEAYGWAGRIDEALQALADASADIGKTEERCWEAELHRLRGEFFRSKRMNRGAEAAACFHAAIEVARGQQAKSLELRAAVSLGRLWRDEGKRTEASRLLAEVYDWFTEGFETPDLRDARSLLEELAP